MPQITPRNRCQLAQASNVYQALQVTIIHVYLVEFLVRPSLYSYLYFIRQIVAEVDTLWVNTENNFSLRIITRI